MFDYINKCYTLYRYDHDISFFNNENETTILQFSTLKTGTFNRKITHRFYFTFSFFEDLRKK